MTFKYVTHICGKRQWQEIKEMYVSETIKHSCNKHCTLYILNTNQQHCSLHPHTLPIIRIVNFKQIFHRGMAVTSRLFIVDIKIKHFSKLHFLPKFVAWKEKKNIFGFGDKFHVKKKKKERKK